MLIPERDRLRLRRAIRHLQMLNGFRPLLLTPLSEL